jgi:hypothetical protein
MGGQGGGNVTVDRVGLVQVLVNDHEWTATLLGALVRWVGHVTSAAAASCS